MVVGLGWENMTKSKPASSFITHIQEEQITPGSGILKYCKNVFIQWLLETGKYWNIGKIYNQMWQNNYCE